MVHPRPDDERNSDIKAEVRFPLIRAMPHWTHPDVEVLVLFLVRRDATSAPGLLSGDEVAYVPVGGTNGIARVVGRWLPTTSGLPVSLDGDPDAQPQLMTGGDGDQVEVPATYELSEFVEFVTSLNAS